MQAVSRETAEHYVWGSAQGPRCEGWHLVKTPELGVIEEFFFVLEGELSIEVEHCALILRPGQGIEISPGQSHQALNKSDHHVRLLVTSQPPSHGDRVVEE